MSWSWIPKPQMEAQVQQDGRTIAVKLPVGWLIGVILVGIIVFVVQSEKLQTSVESLSRAVGKLEHKVESLAEEHKKSDRERWDLQGRVKRLERDRDAR